MGYRFAFEELEVWNRSMELAEKVYLVSTAFPADERFGMMSQVRRASVSVGSNLAEGSARATYRDQANFSNRAYSSLVEVLSQLKLANRLGWIDSEQLAECRKLIEEIANKINALRNSQLRRVQEPEVPYGDDRPSPVVASPGGVGGQQINESTNQRLNYYIHPTAVIDPDVSIGAGSKIWHFCHLMPGAKLGESCSLGQNVFVGKHVELGHNVKVQNNVSIYEGVTCEDDVFLGPSMVFTNVHNPRAAVNRREEYRSTRVRRGATIGANATVLCGLTLGRYAFIGAGAVVTKDVPDYALVAGNPARQMGWMSRYGRRLDPDDNGMAVCPESGEHYRLQNREMVEI